MSSSAGSFIGFGYAFDEDTEFPWNADPFKGDVDFWWRSVNGFKDKHEPYDDRGYYREGWTDDDPRISEFFAEREQWHERNPMPVDVKQFGDLDTYDDEKLFAIVVAGIGCDCLDADDPELFDPSAEKFILHGGNLQAFYEFLERYGIQPKEQPSWMVCCYY